MREPSDAVCSVSFNVSHMFARDSQLDFYSDFEKAVLVFFSIYAINEYRSRVDLARVDFSASRAPLEDHLIVSARWPIQKLFWTIP